MALRYCLRELWQIRDSVKKARISSFVYSTLGQLGIQKPVRGVRAGRKVRECKGLATLNVCNTSIQPADTSTVTPVLDTTDLSQYFHPIPVHTSYRPDYCRDSFKNQPTVNFKNLTKVPVFNHQSKFALMNCQSIRNKTSLVMDHLIEHNIDIAVLTETWLAAGNRDLPIIGELELPGYNLYHQPRQQRGGGVGVIINSAFKVTVQNSPIYSSFETMRLSIQASSVCIHLIVIYRVPPSQKNGLSSTDFMEQFSDFLDTLATLKGKLIIAGDFNIHWDNEDNNEKKELALLLDTYGLLQHVSGQTHIKGHTLDLIITRNDDNCILSTAIGELISDHHVIHSNLQCSKPPPKKKTVNFRKLKSIDPNVLVRNVAETSLCVTPSDSIEPLVQQYQDQLTAILDSIAPVKTKSFVERPLIPWINDEIMECKKEKRKFEKLWRKTKLVVHHQIYLSHKKKLQNLIKKAKTAHYSAKVRECSGHQGRVFKIVAHLQNVKGKQMLPQFDHALDLCNTFNDFFISKISNIRTKLDQSSVSHTSSSNTSTFSGQKLSEFSQITTSEMCTVIKDASNASCANDPIPTKLLKTCLLDTLLPVITKIVNLSLSSGTFPSLFKTAQVKPLLKKVSLNPELLQNYRPVSNLTFVSKLIEKVAANQFVNHLKNNNLQEQFQSAYKPNHSTESALLCVSNDILRAIDQKNCVSLTLLDLSAAFDTIDHGILLDILKNDLGIHDTAFQWFRSYLANRSQCVSIDGVQSDPLDLPYGVPQGSVLGPLLFCAYTTQLGIIIQKHNLKYHIYADDTQLYLSFKVHNCANTLHKLEQCILEIREWMACHKLKLNDDKTEFIMISSPHNNNEINTMKIKIGEETVSASKSVRNLGVVFDSVFNMENHVTSVCQACYFHLRNIHSIRPYLNSDIAAQIVHAFVTTKLDYCNSLIYGLPEKSLHRLKKVQNTAVRIITSCDIKNNITPHLKSLHWLPVNLRIEFKILLFTFKILNGLAPEYLSDLLKYKSSPHNLRSETSQELVVPRTRTTSYGDRAFSVAAPILWNKLPQDMRFITDLDIFKTKLKTYLFTKF